MLPVEAFPLRPRLPGQHKGKLQPSGYPFLWFNDLRPTELTFAPQIFLLLGNDYTNLFTKQPHELSGKKGRESDSKDSRPLVPRSTA